MTFEAPFQPKPFYSLFCDSVMQVCIQAHVVQSKNIGPVAGLWVFPTNPKIFKIKLLGVLLLSTCSTGCRQELNEIHSCTQDESSSSTTEALCFIGLLEVSF